MKSRISYLLVPITVFLMVISACKKDKLNPEDRFSKIYYDSALHNNFYPIDFDILSNNEYIVLSLLKKDTIQNTIPGVYVMQADKYGQSKWHFELENTYVNAVPQLFKSGGAYYFFAMHATSLQTCLFKINPESRSAELVKTFSEITYPLSCSRDSLNNYLLLGFNSVSRSSTLTRISSNFSIEWQKEYQIIEDVVDKIIYHITKTGKQYPFFTGAIHNSGTPTLYYMNGFANYTFSLAFINPADGSQKGGINGFRYDGGISSLLPLTSTDFAFTRFYYLDQYFLSHDAIQTSSFKNIGDFKGIWMPEIQNTLNVKSLSVKLNNKEVTLITAPTKSNTIGLYFYDKTDGKNLLTKFVGDRYPIEPAAVKQASDGSLVLLCRIYESGKFPRISLLKFPPDEFSW